MEIHFKIKIYSNKQRNRENSKRKKTLKKIYSLLHSFSFSKHSKYFQTHTHIVSFPAVRKVYYEKNNEENLKYCHVKTTVKLVENKEGKWN